MKPGCMVGKIPSGKCGQAEIVHDSPDPLTRARAARDGQPLCADKYTRLLINGTCWMTDAEFECWTNSDVVAKMSGDILIAGLGIGLILPTIESLEGVASITVIEKNSDVISLVGPHYPNVKIIEADAYTWNAPKKSYDFIYLDIWPTVPNSDDLPSINKLKEKYRPSLKKGGKIYVWCEKYAKRG